MFDISAYLGSIELSGFKIYYTLFSIDKDRYDDPMYLISKKNEIDFQNKLDNIKDMDDFWQVFFLKVSRYLIENAYPISVPYNQNLYFQVVLINKRYQDKEVEKHVIKGKVIDYKNLDKIHVQYFLEELL